MDTIEVEREASDGRDEWSAAASIGLFGYFHEMALRRPDAAAIVDGHSKLSYRDLDARIDGFYEALRAAGVKAHDQVAVILGNNAGFVVAVLAAWKLGAAVIPLNPLLHEEEFLAYFLDSRPRILITGARNQNLASFLGGAGVAIDHVWLHSAESDDWTYDMSSGTRNHTDAVAVPHVHVDADWPALTQYSTGSTGTPKRVTRTQRQLLAEFLSASSVLMLNETDRVLGVIPFFHSHGLKNAAMLPLFAGATLYAQDIFFPRDVARLIERERITLYPGVPFMFQQLAGLRERYDFSSLRWVFSGGALLEEATVLAFEKAYSIRLRQVYGTTETGLISIQRKPPEFDGVNRVGAPIPGVVVQIVDEDGEPVPEGMEGRVKVTSPFAASKYENSEGNKECHFEDGSYFPGDIGRLSPAGELIMSGRHRGFINVGGNKVDPSEVEAALLEMAQISEAVVFAIPDPACGERVKAVMVATGNISVNDIRAHLMRRLAEFKHPRLMEFRKELPRSPLGKVQRKSLMTELPEGLPESPVTRG